MRQFFFFLHFGSIKRKFYKKKKIVRAINKIMNYFLCICWIQTNLSKHSRFLEKRLWRSQVEIWQTRENSKFFKDRNSPSNNQELTKSSNNNHLIVIAKSMNVAGSALGHIHIDFWWENISNHGELPNWINSSNRTLPQWFLKH